MILGVIPKICSFDWRTGMTPVTSHAIVMNVKNRKLEIATRLEDLA